MLTIVEVLQGGCDLEVPPPQKRSATVGSDNGPLPLRDGIGVDEKWEHQRVHQDPSECESVRTRRARFYS